MRCPCVTDMWLRCIVGVMLPEQGGMTPTLLLGVLWRQGEQSAGTMCATAVVVAGMLLMAPMCKPVGLKGGVCWSARKSPEWLSG